MRLPQELISRVVDFLWDDPTALRNCALTSRAFRPEGAYHLRRYRDIDIKSSDDLALFSKRLSRPNTKRFFRDVSELFVFDNPKKPFTHTVPLRLTETSLPRLSGMVFHGANWTTGSSRPHEKFFSRIALFKSVKQLHLYNSRFCTDGDLPRFIRSFSNLDEVFVCETQFVSPRSAPPALGAVQPAPSHRRCLRILEIADCSFESFYALQRLLHALPDIEQIKIESCWVLGSEKGEANRRMEVLQADADPSRLPVKRLVLHATLPVTFNRAMRWFVSRSPYVVIDAAELALRSPDVGDVVQASLANPQVVQALGSLFGGLQEKGVASAATDSTMLLLQQLAAGIDPYGGMLPLVTSGTLQELNFKISVWTDFSDMRWTAQLLAWALSCISSDSIRSLELGVTFETRSFETDPAAKPGGGSKKPSSPLRDALGRGVFDRLEVVRLSITSGQKVKSARGRSPVMDAAVEILPALFDVWVSRRILEVSLPEAYGGTSP